VVALAALHLLQDNAVQQHGQFGGADLDTRRPAVASSWKAKDALFEALVPQAPAVFFPGQDLEPIALE
jgi:hypothetical protein